MFVLREHFFLMVIILLIMFLFAIIGIMGMDMVVLFVAEESRTKLFVIQRGNVLELGCKL